MSQIVDGRAMSDFEGLMWRLENDPHLSSTFANVTILDREPDFEMLRRRLQHTVMRIPRLRQRVHAAPGNLGVPVWVDDPDFDLDLHLRRVALPKPGTQRQLLHLATLITADPFDRTRPLWQFVVVEGLKGSRAALIEKFHHTISDGEGVVQLSSELLDVERNAAEPPMPTPDDFDRANEDSDRRSHDVVHDLVAGALRLPLGLVRRIKDLLADPTQIPGATSAAADTMRSILDQLRDTDQARSPLWTERSLRRHLEVAHAPLAQTRKAARNLGGTLNTAFMTVATEAASRYHEELGRPVESLRTAMAVSSRRHDSGANAFTLVRMLVPTGEMPIDERFRAIQEACDAAVDQSSTANLKTLATFASTLPTSIVTKLARRQTQTIDFATSNVKGPSAPMFVAGAQMLDNYPIGPLVGVACNLTMLSYDDNLDVGMNIDPAAISEPAVMKRCLERSIEDFVAIAE